MPELELSPAAQQWVNVVLIWVGFGTLSGLLATLVLPMRQPSHPLGTLILGALGSMIGLLGLSWLLQGRQFNPISPLGFLAATAAAILLLILYRACSACFIKKDG
ncbi:MAG: GlsB/YeaQ/YmgE family stress response membrane protein [Thermoguttaceae bacterium]